MGMQIVLEIQRSVTYYKQVGNVWGESKIGFCGRVEVIAVNKHSSKGHMQIVLEKVRECTTLRSQRNNIKHRNSCKVYLMPLQVTLQVKPERKN